MTDGDGLFRHGAPAGTTCAACQSHGVQTLHSPAGNECREWQGKWAQDPSWMPVTASPVPDVSLPDTPSLRDAFKALTPPGTDPDVLMDALKVSRMPSVPLPPRNPRLEWCRACDRPHDPALICPEKAAQEKSDLPPDPLTGSEMAGMAIAEMLRTLTAGGVPLASAERILGAMLAVQGIAAQEKGDTP